MKSKPYYDTAYASTSVPQRTKYLVKWKVYPMFEAT